MAEETTRNFVHSIVHGGVVVDVILTGGNAICMPAVAAIVNWVGN